MLALQEQTPRRSPAPPPAEELRSPGRPPALRSPRCPPHVNVPRQQEVTGLRTTRGPRPARAATAALRPRRRDRGSAPGPPFRAGTSVPCRDRGSVPGLRFCAGISVPCRDLRSAPRPRLRAGTAAPRPGRTPHSARCRSAGAPTPVSVCAFPREREGGGPGGLGFSRGVPPGRAAAPLRCRAVRGAAGPGALPALSRWLSLASAPVRSCRCRPTCPVGLDGVLREITAFGMH